LDVADERQTIPAVPEVVVDDGDLDRAIERAQRLADITGLGHDVQVGLGVDEGPHSDPDRGVVIDD
jgi:hypothetical protein